MFQVTGATDKVGKEPIFLLKTPTPDGVAIERKFLAACKTNEATALPLETVGRLLGRAPRTLAAFLKKHETAFKSLKHGEVRES